MDWTPEKVLDFGPKTHRHVQWQDRANLLVPFRAWRVVTPEPKDKKLNVLQRAVLRLQIAGTRQYERVAEFLGVDRELVALIAQELADDGLVDDSGDPTENGRRLLDDAELFVGDVRVGWVFQDTWSGNLMPRFVTSLEYADVEADEQGKAWIRSGTKGTPRKDRAFVVSPGLAPPISPQPIDIIDAARRHRRHERQGQRAKLDLDAVPAEVVRQVSLISESPEMFFLLTFMYVPEHVGDEEEPWYVADPFGFGASQSLREILERLQREDQDGLREVRDRLTRKFRVQQEGAWLQMQELTREEARERVSKQWPSGTGADDEPIRERLEHAFAELVRLEREEKEEREVRNRFDGVYLKLRQALERALKLVWDLHGSQEAWRKLYQRDR